MPKRVLVVEDVEDARSMMRLMIEKQGVSVIEAAGAYEAIEKAEESLRNLYAYYYSKELPEVILLFERITKINARLIAANLCLRYGRYKRALEHLLRVGMMDPLALFSVQAIRITGNGLIHRRQRP